MLESENVFSRCCFGNIHAGSSYLFLSWNNFFICDGEFIDLLYDDEQFPKLY